MLLKYNYHTHTYRCGHAKGNDEDYVIHAIECGYKVLGFSDHVMLKGYSQPGIRGNYDQLDDYVSSINQLKGKYANQIEIHVGMEAEYYPTMVDYYRELLKSGKIEYLILGQHCFFNEKNEFQWYLGLDNKIQRIKHYVHDLIEGMATGLFTYVAHPDFFIRLFKEYDPIIDKFSREICEASIKYNVPLEMNVSGVQPRLLNENNLHFPNEHFWKIAGELGVKTVIGVDAHNPEEFENSNYNLVFQMIEQYNINFIEDFKL